MVQMLGAGCSRVIQHLIDARLLDGEAALQGRIRIRSLSRSNQVGLLSVNDRPVLVLKRHTTAFDGVDSSSVETEVYRWLARNEETSRMAPRLLAAADEVLALQALDGVQPLYELMASEGEQRERLLRELGRKLAQLHSAPAGSTRHLIERRPWVLAIAEGTAPEALALDAEIGRLAKEIAALASVRSALHALSEAWAPVVPMHGDVKFDNILVSRPTRRDQARVTLIDWELAGLGIPEWDLAGVTEGLIIPGAQLGAAADAVEEAVKAKPMLESYRSEGGSTRTPDNRLLIVATVGRLVQATVQLHAMRHAQPECADTALRVLDCARFLSRQIAGGEALPVWIE